jgi:hypothetical protein
MNINHIPYPKIINDSFTEKIFRHFDVLLGKITGKKFVLSVSGGADSVMYFIYFVNIKNLIQKNDYAQ